MKSHLNLYVALFFICISTFAQAQKTHEDKYKKYHLPDAELIYSGYNYTTEKLNDSTYVYKKYHADTDLNTHVTTFSDAKLSILHGLYKEVYDNSTVVLEGMYVNGRRQGYWTENVSLYGFYSNGRKSGEWIRYSKARDTLAILPYHRGKLHGTCQYFQKDSLRYTSEYERGELISTSRKKSGTESRPRFPGCEDKNLKGKELDKCANESLTTFINKHMRYPKSARKNRIEGKALYSFVIDKEGNMINIKALHSMSNDINKECLRVLKKMPKWIPGMQRGQHVKVSYKLPIKFALN